VPRVARHDLQEPWGPVEADRAPIRGALDGFDAGDSMRLEESEPPKGIRRHLRDTLPPTTPFDAHSPAERWLTHWCLSLAALNPEALADVERRLALGDRGQALSASTAGRYRKVSHACIRRAVELGRMTVDPWPPAPKGRDRRKATRKKRAVDIRRLPSPGTMAAILDAIPSHQPGSHKYKVMTAVAYYAGLRPSEVVYLRPRALHLPADGWGRIDVVEADDGWDEPAEPKMGERSRTHPARAGRPPAFLGRQPRHRLRRAAVPHPQRS
jgi:integrase